MKRETLSRHRGVNLTCLLTLTSHLAVPGRPPQKATSSSDAPDAKHSTKAVQAPPKTKKNRGSYVNWDKCKHRAARLAVVNNLVLTGDVTEAIKTAQITHPTIIVKRQTALSWLHKLQDAASSQNNDNMMDKTLSQFDRDANPLEPVEINGRIGLTSFGDQEFLQTISIARDNRNTGMPRKELIGIIAELAGVNKKMAENHLDYLIRSKHLPNLKKNGCVVHAQATTTNRTAVTMEKLLRTHTCQEEGQCVCVVYQSFFC